MGRIKKGILGGFSGKVGAVVGANWRGIDYIRSLPKKTNKPKTLKQLGQIHKMVLSRGFLLGLDDIIEKCFQNLTKYTPMNEALSYNMLHSIEGEYPDQKMNFGNLLFSKGELRSCWLARAVSIVPNSIDFSWENSNLMPFCSADDQVVLVVYDPVDMQFCKLENAGLRNDKNARLVLPENFSGHTVHCYLNFYSNVKKLASTNEYLGTVDVM